MFSGLLDVELPHRRTPSAVADLLPALVAFSMFYYTTIANANTRRQFFPRAAAALAASRS
jgi:hypothetical protein